MRTLLHRCVFVALLAVVVAGILAGQTDVEALRARAEQGHALAQNNLGVAYTQGKGVPQDDAEAVKWYRKAAEQGHTMKNLRQQTAVPIAIGEKFVHDFEYVDLITGRLIDFIRVHIPAIGGITKSWKLTTLCEWYGVRIVWHAPGDLSPVGHAANAHIDLAAPNFGIQEGSVIHGEQIREVFPGTPIIKNGYLYIGEAPGLGIDIDEKQAARHPCDVEGGNYGPKRGPNGSIIRN